MDYKTCTKCGQTKPITDFHVYSERPLSRCKDCLRKQQRKHRARNPESKEKRRQRYIKESLDSGMRYRVGLKYVLDLPTSTHAKCTKCGQWKTLEHYRKEDSRPTSRPNYYRTICIECGYEYQRKHYVPAPPRPKKTEEEIWAESRMDYVLEGDGCCLYCNQTTFWKLHNHHPWKEIDPEFTLTFCARHHGLFTRGVIFLFEEWY